MTRKVLIASTGRTATRSIAEFFKHYRSDIDAHHITPWSTLFNSMSNAWIDGLLPSSAVDMAWSLIKDGHWRCNIQNNIFIDSNNHLYAWSHALMERYPELLLIHVIRDPRTYVQSHLQWARSKTKSRIANSILPFWQPNPFLIGEVKFGDWIRMNSFERFCWIWDFKNRYMHDVGVCHPGRYLSITMEELVSPDMQHVIISRMTTFIGLGSPDDNATPALRHLNRTNEHDAHSWANLSDEECLQLDRYCGEQMKKYGYGLEDCWLKRLTQSRSMYG